MSNANTLSVGDILRSSWGYDQTNVDWYQVVAVTAKSVRIRKIEAIRVSEDKVLPHPDCFETAPSYLSTGLSDRRERAVYEERGAIKRVQNYNGKPYVTISSYASAYKWDGNSPAYETPANQGH